MCLTHLLPIFKVIFAFQNLFSMNSSSKKQSKWESAIRAMDQSGHMQSVVPAGKDFVLWVSKIHLG